MSEEIRSIMGERLKDERVRLGWSQAAMAEIAGVSRRATVNWESGESTPGADALALMAQAGLDVLYIVTGEVKPLTSDSVSSDIWALVVDYQMASAEGKAAARIILAALASAGNDPLKETYNNRFNREK